MNVLEVTLVTRYYRRGDSAGRVDVFKVFTVMLSHVLIARSGCFRDENELYDWIIGLHGVTDLVLPVPGWRARREPSRVAMVV